MVKLFYVHKINRTVLFFSLDKSNAIIKFFKDNGLNIFSGTCVQDEEGNDIAEAWVLPNTDAFANITTRISKKYPLQFVLKTEQIHPDLEDIIF